MTTMMTRRNLPVLVERSISEAAAGRRLVAFDFEKRARQMGEITCRKGCSHCCYHPLMISVLEGIELYRGLVAQGVWSKLRPAIVEHQDATWGLSLEVWLLSMRPCPLLKDDLCSAYDVRPMSCRITVSVGDPHLCHPHRLDGGSGILPKKGSFEATRKFEDGLLRMHGLKSSLIPMSAAVLLGEQIDKGELELGEAYAYYAEQTLKQHGEG
jgi:Fe-S-cluster containining protein